jgi:hypothetical protein
LRRALTPLSVSSSVAFDCVVTGVVVHEQPPHPFV